MARKCVECGKITTNLSFYCSGCGGETEGVNSKCNYCGADLFTDLLLDKKDGFCNGCGRSTHEALNTSPSSFWGKIYGKIAKFP